MLTRERKTEIETILIEVLQDFGLAIYPMSINRIADALDIELIPHSSLTPRIRELAISASEDGFSLSSPDYAFAQIVFDDRGSYYYRARFSGGHEIGHIVLEHPENGGGYEEEADYFGGYLLVPHPLVIMMGNNATITRVADLFGVSRPCASFAIDQAHARHREGGPWRPHEQWLVDNVVWKGGGLLGRA